jgi:hypothetical protein
MTHQIPQPRKIPFLGNLASIDMEATTSSFVLLYQQYGDIFRLDLVGASDGGLVTFKYPFLTSEISRQETRRYQQLQSPP